MASLITDINHDGKMDLIVGNDFEVPDRFYINIDGDRFGQISSKQNIVPGSPELNMSIDTADYNNDLMLDIYMTGGSWNETPMEERAAAKYKHTTFCQNTQDEKKRSECRKIWMLSKSTLVKDFRECDEMREEFGDEVVRDCLVAKKVHDVKHDRTSCEKVPEEYGIYRTLCDAVEGYPERSKLNTHGFVDQIPVTNILLENSGKEGFIDLSEEKSVHYSGWSWAGKFGDVDNDGWQDIYVANGSVYAAFVGPTTHSPNMFFHNRQGKHFSLKHVSYGLDDFDHSSAFTYIDFDNDGDLDIIGNTTHGGLKLFRNNDTQGNSIVIGNTHCVGCKIYIAYGEDNGEFNQMREIKAGGGFLSFDAPVAHFGLGEVTDIKGIGVAWSTGERTMFKHPFETGYKYTVRRSATDATITGDQVSASEVSAQ